LAKYLYLLAPHYNWELQNLDLQKVEYKVLRCHGVNQNLAWKIRITENIDCHQMFWSRINLGWLSREEALLHMTPGALAVPKSRKRR
jgi:hypothetical protein